MQLFTNERILHFYFFVTFCKYLITPRQIRTIMDYVNNAINLVQFEYFVYFIYFPTSKTGCKPEINNFIQLLNANRYEELL